MKTEQTSYPLILFQDFYCPRRILLTGAVHLSHLSTDAQGLVLGSRPKLTQFPIIL